MIIERIQRVANPTRRKRKYKSKAKRTKNPKRRIKLSAKQIAAGFGGKRRKAATKVKRRQAKRATSRKSNPAKKRRVSRGKTKVVAKTKKRRAHKQRVNNPTIMTLGYLNPERVSMKTRKLKNSRRRTAKAPVRRRRYVAKNPVSRRHRRHRNPDFLGNGMEAIGILVGVAAQKLVKGFIPSSLASGSPLVNIAVSVAVAFAIGKGAEMVTKGKPIGKGIALGALASAASDAVNAFAPQLSGTIGLNGLATYQNALFAVPENPIMRGLPAPSVPVAAKGMGGALAAAFGNSF
jgi:hypothetical protein